MMRKTKNRSIISLKSLVVVAAAATISGVFAADIATNETTGGPSSSSCSSDPKFPSICSAKYFKISKQASGLATSCGAVDQTADPVMGLDVSGCQASCDGMVGCNTINFRWSDPNFGGNSTCYRKRCEDFKTAACTLFTKHKGRDVYTKACGAKELYQKHLELTPDGLFAGVRCPTDDDGAIVPDEVTCSGEEIQTCSNRYYKITNEDNGLATSCAAVDQTADPVMGLDENGCFASCDAMEGGLCNTVNFRWSDPNFGGNSTCYRKHCEDFKTAACTLFTKHKGRDVFTKACGAPTLWKDNLALDSGGLFAATKCPPDDVDDGDDDDSCTGQDLKDLQGQEQSCVSKYFKISQQSNGLATSCGAVDQLADPVMGFDLAGCQASCDGMNGCNTINFRWTDPNFGGNSTCYRKRCENFKTAVCTLFDQHKGRDVYTKACGAKELYKDHLELDANGLFAGMRCPTETFTVQCPSEDAQDEDKMQSCSDRFYKISDQGNGLATSCAAVDQVADPVIGLSEAGCFASCDGMEGCNTVNFRWSDPNFSGNSTCYRKQCENFETAACTLFTKHKGRDVFTKACGAKRLWKDNLFLDSNSLLAGVKCPAKETSSCTNDAENDGQRSCSVKYHKISSQAHGLATSCAAVDQTADPVMGLDESGCFASCDAMEGGCNTVNFRWSDPNFGGNSTCYRKRCEDFKTAVCTLFTKHKGRDVFTKACGAAKQYSSHLELDSEGLLAGTRCPTEVATGSCSVDEQDTKQSCAARYHKISDQAAGLSTSCAAVDQTADPVMGLDISGCQASCDGMDGCNTINFRWTDPNFGGNSTCYRKRCEDFKTAVCTLFTKHKGRDVYTKACGASNLYKDHLELDSEGLFAGLRCPQEKNSTEENVCTRVITTNSSNPTCDICSKWSGGSASAGNIRSCLVWERNVETGITSCATYAESAIEIKQKEEYNQYLRERWTEVGLCRLQYKQGSTCEITREDGGTCEVRDQPCHGGTDLGGVAGVLSAGWQMTFGTDQDNHVCTMCGRGTYGSCQDACAYRRNFFWSGYNLGRFDADVDGEALRQLYDAFVGAQPVEDYEEPQTLELTPEVLARLPPSNPLSASRLPSSSTYSLISVNEVSLTTREQVKFLATSLESENDKTIVPAILSTSGVKVYETCSCYLCPRGHFQDGLGETSCKRCEDILPGSDTEDTGAQGPEKCKCLKSNDNFLSWDNSTCVSCDLVRDGLVAAPSGACDCPHNSYETMPPSLMGAPEGWITCTSCPNQSSTFNVDSQEHDYGASLSNCYCKPGTYGLSDCATCPPCRKAFEVDVFPDYEKDQLGCEKMALCGGIEQSKELVYRIKDNKKRIDVDVEVNVWDGSARRSVNVKKVPFSDRRLTSGFDYEFVIISRKIGVLLFEVLVDGEQIPQSPLRLEIEPRNCLEDTGDSLREANADGDCVCEDGSVEIFESCVSLAILVPSMVIPIFLITFLAIFWYVRYKQKQADSVWEVKTSELTFDDPPEIVGRGTFGLVLLAEYRGTQVAVKRVIPPRSKSSRDSQRGSANGEKLRSMLGRGDIVALARRSSELTKDESNAKQSDLTEHELPLDPSDDGRAAQFEGFEQSQTDNDETSIDKGSHEREPAPPSQPRQQLSRGTSTSSMGRRKSLADTKTYFDFEALEDGDGNHEIDEGLSKMESGLGCESEGHERPQRRSSLSGLDSFQSKQPRPRAQRRLSFQGSTMYHHTPVDDAAPAVPQSEQWSQNYQKSVPPQVPPANGSTKNFAEKDTAIAKAAKYLDGLKSGTLPSSIGPQLKFHKSGFLSRSGLLSRSTKRRWLWCHQRSEYSRLKADFIREMRHLSKLRHPCITTVMGAVIAKREEPMLVMEYMDHGSLYDLLHNETFVIDGELLLPILRDIAQGLRFLHAAEPQVVHGDMKSQNVLVDSRFRAKVADFGLSQKKHIGACGTPLWMAPELLRGESTNTAESDVYSFGIILYEVYSRKDPYEGEDYREVIRLVCDPKVNKRPIVPPSCPPHVTNLIKDCLVGLPENRPTAEEVDLRLKLLDVTNVEPGAMNFSKQIKKSQKERNSDDLLFDVFPQHIAEALRDGRKVEPEQRDCVTIFFSDIVGFTSISMTLSPLKISDMLDRLYLKFDELSRKHDVFKVETIGDAYMAAGNLVKDQSDHTKRIAEFAIEAIKAASETPIDTDNPSRGYIMIRVGFHSGPVCTNVVGSRNPRYTLFGDTVNTASRMESTSEAGRIQCSDHSAVLLQSQCPSLPLQNRGSINVKGKGEMVTFWVNESPSASSRNAMDASSTSDRINTSKSSSFMWIKRGSRAELNSLAEEVEAPENPNHNKEQNGQIFKRRKRGSKADLQSLAQDPVTLNQNSTERALPLDSETLSF